MSSLPVDKPVDVGDWSVPLPNDIRIGKSDQELLVQAREELEGLRDTVKAQARIIGAIKKGLNVNAKTKAQIADLEAQVESWKVQAEQVKKDLSTLKNKIARTLAA